MLNGKEYQLSSIRWLIVVIPVFTLVLVACGVGNLSSDNDELAIQEVSEATPAAASSEQQALAEAGQNEPYSASDTSRGDERVSSDLVASSISFDRFIVRSSQLTLKVQDVGDATVWVRDLASRRQGFVFASSGYTENSHQFSQVTIRVPAEQFDGTLSELQSAPFVIEVEREESSSQDVSAEYVDNESRLIALEETERRYLSLLSEADTIDEILRVEYELNTVRTEIESIQGRQNYLDEMTSFSTITVTLQPDTGTASTAAEGNSGFIGKIFGDAWDRSEGILQTVLTFAITAGIVGLVFLPFVAVGFVAYRLVRSRTQQPVTTEPEAPVTQ